MHKVVSGVLAAGMLCVGGSCQNPAIAKCEAFLDTVVNKAISCEEITEAQQAMFRQVIEPQATLNQGCGNAVRIANEQTYFDECLPGIEDLDCADFIARRFPSACTRQILFRER